jgi:hypothetical protein
MPTQEQHDRYIAILGDWNWEEMDGFGDVNDDHFDPPEYLDERPFVLVETSRSAQVHVTTHKTARDAMNAWFFQEYMEDWDMQQVIDTRDGTQYQISVEATPT